jgi:hypothetical protein
MWPSCLAAVAREANRLDVFGAGDDGIWHSWWNGQKWQRDELILEGGFQSPPAAVSWSAGRLDLFAVGWDGAMWHTFWDGGAPWADWKSLGGSFTSPPAAVSREKNRIDVFALGLERAMWHNSWDGGAAWAGWKSLGGSFASAPAAMSWDADRLDVFGVGQVEESGIVRVGVMLHNSWELDSPFEPAWQSLGGSFTSPPAVVSREANRLDVFGVGDDGAMWHNRSDGGVTWADWKSLGGENFKGAPAAVAGGANRINVFGVQALVRDFSVSYQMWRNWWEGQDWQTDWEELPSLPSSGGGQLTGAPAVVAREADQLDVFGVGDGSAAWHRAWHGNQWSSDDWERLQGTVLTPFLQGPVAPTPHNFGSDANYLLFSNCRHLQDVEASIEITEELVGSNGFGLQLNASSPNSFTTVWQQYLVVVQEWTLRISVELWHSGSDEVINEWFTWAAFPWDTLQAGDKFTIQLKTDTEGNVIAASFVGESNGSTFDSQTIVLTELETTEGNEVTQADLAPVVAFELDIVGPDNGQSTELSGGGTIRYYARPSLTPLSELPTCVESRLVTRETSNCLYGTLPLLQSNAFSQPFRAGSAVFVYAGSSS